MTNSNQKEENIYISLKNDEGKILLKNKNYNFEFVQKNNTSDYFSKIKRYSSLTIKKQEIQCKKELEKSVFLYIINYKNIFTLIKLKNSLF